MKLRHNTIRRARRFVERDEMSSSNQESNLASSDRTRCFEPNSFAQAHSRNSNLSNPRLIFRLCAALELKLPQPRGQQGRNLRWLLIRCKVTGISQQMKFTSAFSGLERPHLRFPDAWVFAAANG